jgi:hypothetical protein
MKAGSISNHSCWKHPFPSSSQTKRNRISVDRESEGASDLSLVSQPWNKHVFGSIPAQSKGGLTADPTESELFIRPAVEGSAFVPTEQGDNRLSVIEHSTDTLFAQ